MSIPAIQPTKPDTSSTHAASRFILPKQFNLRIAGSASTSSLRSISPANVRFGTTSAVSTPSTTGATRPSIFVRVAQVGTSISTVATAARDTRRMDKEAGIGIFEGAQQFARAVVNGSLDLSERGLEKAGSAGRAGLLMKFGKELQAAAGTGAAVSAPPASAISAPARPEADAGIAVRTASSGAAVEGAVAATAGGGFLPFVGAIYSGYQLINNFGNTNIATGALNGIALGAYIGSVFPGIGTLAGGIVGGLLGGVSGLFRSSGKHVDQVQRDELRKILQQGNLLDSKFAITLEDGSRFDLGKDGGAKLANLDGSARRYYETDGSNPLSKVAVGLVNPLAQLIAAGNPKAASDLAAMLANAAMSNAKTAEDVRKNVAKFISTLGVSQDDLNAALSAAAQQGRISRNDADSYLNGVATAFHAETLAEQNPGI